jgi:hypothetical protein
VIIFLITTAKQEQQYAAFTPAFSDVKAAWRWKEKYSLDDL